MCELLVKALDAVHPDPETDRRGCYKRGSPVVVMEDGHQWGAAEGLPTFWIVKLPGVSVTQAQKYIDSWLEAKVLVQRREWMIDVDLLPAAALALLSTVGIITIRVPPYNGAYDVTWAQARATFRNTRTGLTE